MKVLFPAAQAATKKIVLSIAIFGLLCSSAAVVRASEPPLTRSFLIKYVICLYGAGPVAAGAYASWYYLKTFRHSDELPTQEEINSVTFEEIAEMQAELEAELTDQVDPQ